MVESVNTVDVKRVLYDLCSCVIAGSLRAEQALSGLVEVAVSPAVNIINFKTRENQQNEILIDTIFPSEELLK